MASSTGSVGSGNATLVKVSMDGVPFLRKVELKMYTNYEEFTNALAQMFDCFTLGMADFLDECKLMDLLTSTGYVTTYQDKDGDWMLVGDLPWEMFIDSCKRLRIMTRSEAMGLAPSAIERCRTRHLLIP